LSSQASEVHAGLAHDHAISALTAAFWILSIGGLAVAAGSAVPHSPTRLAVLGILAAGGFVTESFAVRVGPGSRAEVSAGGIVIILAAVLLGPFAAGIVGFAELLRDARRPPLARWLAHAPLRCMIALAAGEAASRVGHASDSGLLAAVVAAWAAMTVVDIAGNSAIARLRGLEVGAFLRDSLAACYLPFVFYLPIVWATAVAYRSAGIAALVMVLGPTLLAQYIYHLYQQRGQAYDDLTEASLSFAIGMIRALDASDSYTAGHSASVGVYARDLAIELGYPSSAASVVQLAALLHDVGKIGVSGEILRKPSKLNDEEWSEIRRHPAIGQQITGEVPAFRWIAEAIRHHHERPDGRGYPDGLAGDDIPHAALIIGAADAYSAMTSPRAYRDAITPLDASVELQRCAGGQFDTDVVSAFLRVLDERPYGYRAGEGDDFAIAAQRAEILSHLGRAGALNAAIATA
jgi:HD-GYP domain-containing protein (c-di-GMP phosphodiesterase class II)